TLYLCQKKIKVLQTQYLSKFAALSTHTFCPITLILLAAIKAQSVEADRHYSSIENFEDEDE
ncbi:hypothetical protein, partial [Veillonella sp.]|uniref:hypothetical protein n=1 Tax=Veillonella sp. TaxID=1926307 RepID=UPI0025CCE711